MKQINAHDVNLKDNLFFDTSIYEIVMIRKLLLEGKVILGLKLLGNYGSDLERYIEKEYGLIDKINVAGK
jgi:hypothetical protein